ncbi:hypothetical protein I4U23_018218 [Adineta vaga]|nr:hypothetical protein I4U23_018218 [Adineta vaga]
MFCNNEILDCTFYQTTDTCQTSSYSNRSISSSDTKFRHLRHYFNDIRCRMLTKLIQRNITGEELIQAFEQAPNIIEKMSITNSNIHNDCFMDQLVNVTYNSIIQSPKPCISTSRLSETNINRNPQPSPPLPIKSKINSLPSPRNTISSSPTSAFSLPKFLPPESITPPESRQSSLLSNPPHRSSDDISFSMGYQWKGEDN